MILDEFANCTWRAAQNFRTEFSGLDSRESIVEEFKIAVDSSRFLSQPSSLEESSCRAVSWGQRKAL